jgi:hypothetical protein
MPNYSVTATVSFLGWVEVEADTEEAALDEARTRDASDFDLDPGTGDVEFNVTPAVEPA